MEMIVNLSVVKAAEIMDKSPQFVRVGLQRGLLSFGTAVKMSSKWTYHISTRKFCEYMGITEDKLGDLCSPAGQTST